MKVQVIREKCISCGLCVSSVPAVFEFDGDGLAIARESGIADADAGEIQAAADGCPTSAIEVER